MVPPGRWRQRLGFARPDPEQVRDLEYVLIVARITAVVWAGSRLFLVQAGAVGPEVWRASVTVIVGFAAGTAVLGFMVRRVGTRREAAIFSLLSFGFDGLVLVATVLAMARLADQELWELLLLLPVEGGVRFQVPGGMVGWVVGSVTAAATARIVGVPLALDAASYRGGLMLVVALVIGLMSAEQQRARRRAAAHLAELERAEAWRSRMVATLAHDVRSPVATIVMLGETIRDRLDDLPPERRDQLATSVVRQGERVQALARDLLDLARMEQGTFVLDRQVVDVRPLIDRVLESEDVDAVVDVPSGLRADVDAGRVEQLIANLVVNARRHGAPPIEVTARSEGGALVLAVADHGDGVPADVEAAQFAAFAQGRRAEGLGLGLWIVQQIAEAHGGSVAYQPAPWGGARFVVRLPGAVDVGVHGGAADRVP